MKKAILHLLSFALVSCMISCCDSSLDLLGMMDGQSPDVNRRFEDRTSKDMGACDMRLVISPSDEYKVYVGSDTHIDLLAATSHTDAFLQAYANDPDAPMALILGDLVNSKDCMKMASDRVREMAGDKAGTVFLAMGNHDIYFNLWREWEREWGLAAYSVEVRTPSCSDLYICMDSASGYLGCKQLEWLKDILDETDAAGFRHRIVYTHTHMFKKDGSQGHTSNYPIEETWEITSLLHDHGVELFLSGHCHSRDVSWFNGVEYVVLDALDEHCKDGVSYAILTSGKTLDYDFVSMN